MCAHKAALDVRDSRICGNVAHKQGGGIYQFRGTLTIANCDLCNNEAREGSAQGGAIWAQQAKLDVRDSRICDNIAHKGKWNQGSGIWLFGSMLTMSNSKLHNDTAGQGAALYMGPSSRSTVTLDEDCSVKGSVSGKYTTVPRRDVGLVTTTDAYASSHVGSFKLVMATEPSRALAKDHQYDINDEWNQYGASTRLTDLHAAATFCFAADNEHVSLEADRYLGLEVNCHQVVEGGSCCLLRSKNQPVGGSGRPWKINSDGTLSPKDGKHLVLGFGPITYNSWNRHEQRADSIGGANFVAIGLFAPTSAHRLVVRSSTATPPPPTTWSSVRKMILALSPNRFEAPHPLRGLHRLLPTSLSTHQAITTTSDCRGR